MARLPRLAIAGQLHLLTQRAHGGNPVFVDEDDHRLYLESLRQAAREQHVTVHAYALLPDRVVLLATPAADDGLGRMLQSVGRRFGAAVNRRRGRSGALWDGRFRTAVLDAPHHLFDAIRYVEQMPVAAGVVAEAMEHRWSSAAHHGGRRSDPLITEHPLYWQLGNTPFEREARHRALLEERLAPTVRTRLEEALQKSWAVGPVDFLRSLAAFTDRPLGPRVRGRPKGVNLATIKTVPK